jgi:Ca-activated chloride channel family protein
MRIELSLTPPAQGANPKAHRWAVRTALGLWCLFCAIGQFSGHDLSFAQDQGEVVHLRAHLVVVPVSVTASGLPVRHLTADDFLLMEEGQRQQVKMLGEPGKTPIELSLLFDISGSVHARFKFEQEAAVGFLKEVLNPNDAVSVFLIGLRPRRLHSRTTESEKAIAALVATEPTKEATAFFDTVVQAAHDLNTNAGAGARRVLVVISDGEDNHSEQYKLSDALRVLQRSDCLFYSINPSGSAIRLNKISLKGQAGMETLAAETGGAAFLPEKHQDLEAAFRQIAVELQAQYVLGYYSTNEQADGRFRQITVQVPHRPDLRVRARQGYYALKF